MKENLIVSAIFILYGLLAGLKPQWLARYQTWANKKILGAEFKASKKTLNFYRGMGIFMAGIGVLVLFLN